VDERVFVLLEVPELLELPLLEAVDERVFVLLEVPELLELLLPDEDCDDVEVEVPDSVRDVVLHQSWEQGREYAQNIALAAGLFVRPANAKATAPRLTSFLTASQCEFLLRKTSTWRCESSFASALQCACG
jgi:hypothetical protein